MYQNRQQLKVKPRATTVNGKFQADMEAVNAYADSIDSISTPSDSQRE